MGKNLLFAGWSSIDITPAKKVLLYGQYHERISEGVHDPLYATALAIESKTEEGKPLDYAIIISCDIIGVEKIIIEKLRDRLNGKIRNFDTNKILISAIHTHTAPCVLNEDPDKLNWTEWKKLRNEEFMSPLEYQEFLIGRLEELAVKSWENRKPAKMSIELGHAVVGHCRRVVYDDRAIMYGSVNTANFIGLESPSDHGVELMYFWDMEDKLTGVVVNVACPAQVVELMCVISADYFGAARRKIKEKISDDIYVLPQISPAGDQSPRDLIRRGKSENIMFNDFEGMEELGLRVADAVIRQYESARQKAQCDPTLRHIVSNIYLPIRKVTQGEIEKAENGYNEIMKNYTSEKEVLGEDLAKLVDCRAVILRGEIQETAPLFKVELHAVRLGDAVFVTNPFELFIEYGFRIKARSKAKQTFAIQLSGGNGGYLPTRMAIEGGSYGANVANGTVGPEGGDLLVEYSVAAINRLWGEQGYTEKWSLGN